jgi:FAD/FMN-containing dehydrogenase
LAAASQPPRHEGVRKESSGYAIAAAAESGDLVDILVGSEGTLAFFTAVELRLAPRANATASALASFSALEGAVEAAAVSSALGASACELLDRTFLEVVASAGPLDLPTGTEAVLLIEVEGDGPAECEAVAAHIRAACRKAGASVVQLALDSETEKGLWTLRHAASPILAALDPRLKSMQFIEDGCVPPAALPAYVRGVRAALDGRGVRGVIFGHAGDANVHVNPLIDVSKPDWRRQVEGLLEEVTALTASLGGTLTGEHGDGRLRTPLLSSVWSGDALADFSAIKNAADPKGILNPGVKCARTGQRAIQNVKYDPQLPELVGTARRVLDYVERERAYDQSRLELLDRSR